jgi:hypothetical protein
MAGGMRRARKWLIRMTVLTVIFAIAVFAVWTWTALTFTYSTGDRAGYVQKFSKKGWLFKTWEGELAMANLPGAMPEIFQFSVRDDSAAVRIQASLGRRVRIKYDQHVGIPVSWFGETEYFVVDVQVVEDAQPPR